MKISSLSFLGTGDANKTDEFSEKFQTAFDPPSHFQKIILQFVKMDMIAYMQVGMRAR